MWHGWKIRWSIRAPANYTRAWSRSCTTGTRRLRREAPGPTKETDAVPRLFMVPGMTPACSDRVPHVFDTLTPLERWVEQGGLLSGSSRVEARYRTAPGRSARIRRSRAIRDATASTTRELRLRESGAGARRLSHERWKSTTAARRYGGSLARRRATLINGLLRGTRPRDRHSQYLA